MIFSLFLDLLFKFVFINYIYLILNIYFFNIVLFYLFIIYYIVIFSFNLIHRMSDYFIDCNIIFMSQLIFIK
jgi:hypothetical protein